MAIANIHDSSSGERRSTRLRNKIGKTYKEENKDKP